MFAGSINFGQKWVQVFAVECLSCGGSVGERSGGLGRWCFGELGGGFWDDYEDCGARNLEVEGGWFCEWWLGCLGLILGEG